MSLLLNDITSGDTRRIWSSSCAIAQSRDAQELDFLAAHVPEIEAKTAGIDLGGAWVPNRVHLEFALRKLRYHAAKAGCLCQLYPEYLFFDPTREETAGNNIRILNVIYDRQWIDHYRCQCPLCGSQFRVEELMSHYTWWKWTVAE